jgi:DNA-binding transcriptional MerR regulator
MYKDYKKDTNKGEDEELIKISKELEKASKELERYLKDIIYYKDRDDNKIYCFSLFELLEEINNKNYINVYNNKPFSEDFINYVKKHKKPSVKSIVELKEGFKELVFDSINNLDMSLMSLMSLMSSKDLICKYYNDYVFSKTEFEERLKKTDIQIEKLKNYCESKESNEDVEDEKDKKDLEDEKNDQVKELKQNKKIKLRDLLKDKSSLISSKSSSSSSSKVSRKLSGTRRRSRIKNLIKDE